LQTLVSVHLPLLALLFGCFACQRAGGVGEYAPEEIRIEADSMTDESRRVYFTVLEEEADHHCVGANLERLGSLETLTFVRAPRGESPRVDLPVQHSTEGIVGAYVQWPLTELMKERGGEARLAISGRGETTEVVGTHIRPPRGE
jgi:hypothetical protein